MDFDLSNAYTTVTAHLLSIGVYGYFSNDLESLRNAVQNGKTSFRVVYARLDYILKDKFERRFGNECGNFTLFYPLEKEHNVARY